MKIKTSLIILLFVIVLLISSMSMKAFTIDNGTIMKIATPFRPIAVKLLENSNFPIYLPRYLPSLERGKEWIIKPEVNNNSFSIEIDQHDFGGRSGTGMYAGTFSGNVGTPLVSPLEDQFVSENTEVKAITLPNGIEGKEYIMDLDAFRAISWEIGEWSYFVAARQDNNEDSARNYASEIIKTIGVNGLAISDSTGKLYFLYLGANHPTIEIFWKVNDSVWYQLDWRDYPSDAIKILRSMKYIG